MFKKEKGVTLIALVITIIVLLILAAVSIAMLSGDNGILNNATRARAASAIADAKSAIATEIANRTTDYYVEQYTNETSSGETNPNGLGIYLDDQGESIALAAQVAAGGAVSAEGTQKVVKVTYSNGVFTITYVNNSNYYSTSSAIAKTDTAAQGDTTKYMTWTDSPKLAGTTTE